MPTPPTTLPAAVDTLLRELDFHYVPEKGRYLREESRHYLRVEPRSYAEPRVVCRCQLLCHAHTGVSRLLDLTNSPKELIDYLEEEHLPVFQLRRLKRLHALVA